MKIKVCGMKYENNIKELTRLSPNYMGFIFYEKSKRYVGDIDESILLSIPKTISTVGVFVNSTVTEVLIKAKKYKLDYVQLHGSETVEMCAEIAKHIRIIKAFGINEEFDFRSIEEYKNYCAYYLFDTKSKTFGGTGKHFDWNILKNYNGDVPFFLSGGISLEDVNEIKKLRGLNIHAVDLNSKFENKPGEKNILKIKQFINETSMFGYF